MRPPSSAPFGGRSIQARRYRADGAEPVAVDLTELQKLGCRVILDNLLEEHGVIRHNPERLARLLLEEFLGSSPH